KDLRRRPAGIRRRGAAPLRRPVGPRRDPPAACTVRTDPPANPRIDHGIDKLSPSSGRPVPPSTPRSRRSTLSGVAQAAISATVEPRRTAGLRAFFSKLSVTDSDVTLERTTITRVDRRGWARLLRQRPQPQRGAELQYLAVAGADHPDGTLTAADP